MNIGLEDLAGLPFHILSTRFTRGKTSLEKRELRAEERDVAASVGVEVWTRGSVPGVLFPDVEERKGKTDHGISIENLSRHDYPVNDP